MNNLLKLHINTFSKMTIFCLLLFFSLSISSANTVLKSASEYDYPPFCLVTEKGNAEGFSVELLSEVAKIMGKKINFYVDIWQKIKQDLVNNKIDVLPLVGKTPERNLLFDFSIPYITLHGMVFKRKNDDRIKTFEDIKDMQILVMNDDNAEEFVHRIKISPHIFVTDTYTEAMKLLSKGEYDVVVAQRLMGIQLLKQLNIKNVVPLEKPIETFDQKFCFAVKKGNTDLLEELNEGLSIVMANGTFQKLYTKWFSPILVNSMDIKKIAKIVIPGIVISFIIAMLIALFFARRKIHDYRNQLNGILETTKTNLKSTEKDFNLACDAAKLGMWWWTVDTDELIFSKIGRELFKILPDIPLNYEKFFQYIHPDDRENLDKTMKESINHQEGYTTQYRIIHPDGTIHWIEAKGFPYYNELNKIDRLVGIIFEITKQKTLEDQIITSEKMAQLGNLVAGTTHEINTAIGISLTASSMLQEKTKKIIQLSESKTMKRSDLNEFFKSVQESTKISLSNIEKAANFIKSLKTISVDQVCEEKRIFNLKEYLDEIILSLRPKLKKTEHVVTIKCPGDITINSFPGAFSQIFSNLIINSLIHGFENIQKGEITIEAILENNNLKLIYRDNGNGIKAEHIPELFDQYFTTKRNSGGSGLGTHIIYTLITEQLNGTIECQSTVGIGTTFTIQLPI